MNVQVVTDHPGDKDGEREEIARPPRAPSKKTRERLVPILWCDPRKTLAGVDVDSRVGCELHTITRDDVPCGGIERDGGQREVQRDLRGVYEGLEGGHGRRLNRTANVGAGARTRIDAH